MTIYGVDRDGPGIGSSANIPPLLSNGTQPLTADWPAGNFKISARQFESTVTTGTPPLIVASTTKVNNLNADLLDGLDSTYLLNHSNLTNLSADTHTQYVLANGTRTGVRLAIGDGDFVGIGGGATNGELRFYEPSGGGTNYLSFKAPTLAANINYIWPNADAAVPGYALKSDGSGNLSWGEAGGSDLKSLVTQTSHGFVAGDWVYLNGSTYTKARADTVATAETVGMVSSVVNANQFYLQQAGFVTGLSGLTPGTVYFLSPTTAGAMTATEPSTVGEVSKPVFIAATATSGWVVPLMRGEVVGSAASTLAVQNFSGDGSTVNFTLSSSPHENNTFVMVEGVYQQKNTYSISGSTLTFAAAPPAGTNNIEVVTVGSVNIGTPSDGTVTTAKLVDGAVTVAKLAAGAGLTFIGPNSVGTGPFYDVTGIPAGVTHIEVIVWELSNSVTANQPILQLGDAGGIETAGYICYGGYYGPGTAGMSATAGFIGVGSGGVADSSFFHVVLRRINAATNTWFATAWGATNNGGTVYTSVTVGIKSLSEPLDRIRITNSGSFNFDAGQIVVGYR